MPNEICKFTRQPGTETCGQPAPHIWGALRLCCEHFDQLVTAMFEIRGLIHDRQHKDFLRTYEERTQRSATIEGAPCAIDKPDGEK
jgi:hypothetical protein